MGCWLQTHYFNLPNAQAIKRELRKLRFNNNMNTRRNIIKTIGSIGAVCLISNIANAAGGGAKPAQESNFILPTQVNGNVMANGRAIGIMQIDIGVYTTDAALKSKLTALAPVLRANWRAALQEFIVKYYLPGTVPDALILTGLLQRTLIPHMGNARGRILLQSIIAR